MDYSLHENVKIQPDIQVRFIIYEDSSLLITNHWHNSLEILLIRSGGMNVWVNDNLYRLKKDDFIIINSCDIHATKCTEPSVIQLLQIPYQFLQTEIPDIDSLSFLPEAILDPVKKAATKSRITELLYEMGEIYEDGNTGYALQFKSLLFHFLYLLIRDCKSDVNSALKMKNEINRKRLTLVIDYIKLHYAEPVTLTDAAALISLNPQYFCRFFKKNMGTTFLNYINEVRLSHIYRDIINTNNSITQILETHGFTNYKLFMKLFREKYGCTPIKKRRQCISRI